VRYHTCYGINEEPRIHEVAPALVIGYVLKVNAGQVSFEAANLKSSWSSHAAPPVFLPSTRHKVSECIVLVAKHQGRAHRSGPSVRYRPPVSACWTILVKDQQCLDQTLLGPLNRRCQDMAI
jgi:hypothetical protein